MSMTEEQKNMEVFHHRLPIQIRFNDVDGYGHVNNNAYFAFYDLGKESYLAEVLQKDFRTGDVVPVVANINANFLFPIFYGDSIVVSHQRKNRDGGLRVLHGDGVLLAQESELGRYSCRLPCCDRDL